MGRKEISNSENPFVLSATQVHLQRSLERITQAIEKGTEPLNNLGLSKLFGTKLGPEDISEFTRSSTEIVKLLQNRRKTLKTLSNMFKEDKL